MSTQPKALRLADVLAEEGDSWWDDQAAAELRRLHAVNQELLEALRKIAEWPDGGNQYGQSNIKRFARADIAKATGEKT